MAKYTEIFELYLPENKDPSQIHEYYMQENFIKIEELILGKSQAGQDFSFWDPAGTDPTIKKVIRDTDGQLWTNHANAKDTNAHATMMGQIHADTNDLDLSQSIIKAINDSPTSNPHNEKIDGRFLNVSLGDIGGVTFSNIIVTSDEITDPGASSELHGLTEILPDISDNATNLLDVRVNSVFNLPVTIKQHMFIDPSAGNIYKDTIDNDENRYMVKHEIRDFIKEVVNDHAATGDIPSLKVQDAVTANRLLATNNSLITVENAMQIPSANIAGTLGCNNLNSVTATFTGDVEGTNMYISSMNITGTLNVSDLATFTSNVSVSGTIEAVGNISSHGDVIGFLGG
jgi:hypothetical protein